MDTVLRNMNCEVTPPIVLVLHRTLGSGTALKNLLDRHLPRVVTEPDDKEPLKANTFYLAPAGYHLLVDKEGFHLSTDEPVCHSRPSIDVLFESAAHAFKDRALGVILTGASADGAEGAAQIVEQGGEVLVQDPETAENPALPKATIKRLEKQARVMSLVEIGRKIANGSASKRRLK